MRATAVRIDAEDMRRLAEASRAVLGTVARDSARYLARRAVGRTDKRRPEQSRPAAGRSSAGPRPRRRFKRRWVVVPTLLLLLLGVLVVLGAVWLIAVLTGTV